MPAVGAGDDEAAENTTDRGSRVAAVSVGRKLAFRAGLVVLNGYSRSGQGRAGVVTHGAENGGIERWLKSSIATANR